jgi:RNA recognition motif-containing protein
MSLELSLVNNVFRDRPLSKTLTNSRLKLIWVKKTGTFKEAKMNNKLYVGQISFQADSESLRAFFAQVGEVLSAKIITDRDTGRSKGFGFVEMATDDLAQAAINKLNGQELNGRPVNVTIAKPQEPRTGGGGGGRGGFGGGRGGGGGRY